MEDILNQIAAQALNYFDKAAIESFNSEIAPWIDDCEKYFFQVTQRNEKAILEFAAYIKGAVIDITMSKDLLRLGVIILSNYTLIILEDSSSSTSLKLTTGVSQFNYLAVNDMARKSLREFGKYLQAKMLKG